MSMKKTLRSPALAARSIATTLDGEAALAAAELHADLLRLGHQVVPAALALVGVLDLIRPATLHAGKQVFLFAHSHSMILIF